MTFQKKIKEPAPSQNSKETASNSKQSANPLADDVKPIKTSKRTASEN